MASLTAEQVWEILEEVKDPEIPVVSVVELGLIRSVGVEEQNNTGASVVIKFSPTFIGCPAIQVMQSEIEARLRQAGAASVQVKLALSPPWTSDWITPAGRIKLKDFGLAPPPRHAGQIELALSAAASCPYCDSADTTLKNNFGPTLCRAIYYCNSCQQPFEQFKPT